MPRAAALRAIERSSRRRPISAGQFSNNAHLLRSQTSCFRGRVTAGSIRRADHRRTTVFENSEPRRQQQVLASSKGGGRLRVSGYAPELFGEAEALRQPFGVRKIA